MSLPGDRGPHLIAINPVALGAPKGYSNGMLAPSGGRLLTIAGQIAWNQSQRLVCDDFRGQFVQALSNVVTVVRSAGGYAEDIAQLTIFVTSRVEYLASLDQLGQAYRMVMGRHYPAMALVEVSALVEPGAKVEIQGLAVLAPERDALLDSIEPLPESATITEFPAAMAPSSALASSSAVSPPRSRGGEPSETPS